MLFNSSDTQKHFVLGFDLGNKVSQISYLSPNSDMPETLSVLAGAELYNIPTVLCRRRDVNQWFYGKEAIKRIEEGDGVEVSGLIDLARSGEMVKVMDDEYDPVALLTLFVKRSLSLLSMEVPFDNVDAIMFTSRTFDDEMVRILNEVTSTLGLKCKIFYQGHEESFYNYMLYQPSDLMTHGVLAFDYDFGDLYVYELNLHRNTSPIVATITKHKESALRLSPESLSSDAMVAKTQMERLDQDFCQISEKVCAGKIISTAYLLGDGFRDGWMKRSLEFLCRTRRVFQGNNLFSKGAAIAAREKINRSEASDRYVYLGDDKLKSNLGIECMKAGQKGYHALLDAGINWFEAQTSVSMILGTQPQIDIVVTPLTGGEARTETILLDELEIRPERTTRVRIDATMKSIHQLYVRVADMGFGELFPSTGKVWTKTFTI